MSASVSLLSHFTFTVCILSAILFGLAPALRSSRLDVQTTLRDTSRTSAGVSAIWGRGNNLRRSLVIAEIVLCAMLLIGAGLLIRSFARVRDANPGFNPHNVLTLELMMAGERYKDKEAVLAAYHDLWQRLESLPGVTAAGAVTSLPLSQMFAWGPITVEGRVSPPGEKFINADIRVASGHYFRQWKYPCVRAGYLTTMMSSTNAVLLSSTITWRNNSGLARIPSASACVSEASAKRTVAGVVGRVKQYTLDAGPTIALYVPQMQYMTRSMNIVMRSNNDPAALAGAVKQQIHELNPDLPLYNVSTMQERLNIEIDDEWLDHG